MFRNGRRFHFVIFEIQLVIKTCQYSLHYLLSFFFVLLIQKQLRHELFEPVHLIIHILFLCSIWKSYGVNVKISTASITTREGCKQVIKESLELGRIDAIFNLAVVLADGLFENQTSENFKTSFGPKAYATEYLDELTRKLCPDLR